MEQSLSGSVGPNDPDRPCRCPELQPGLPLLSQTTLHDAAGFAGQRVPDPDPGGVAVAVGLSLRAAKCMKLLFAQEPFEPALALCDGP